MTIALAGADDTAKRADERNKGVIFKICVPFADCISERNNTWIDHAKDIDVVMPMYNLIEYGDNYSKRSEMLWQYYAFEYDGTPSISSGLLSVIEKYT